MNGNNSVGVKGVLTAATLFLSRRPMSFTTLCSIVLLCLMVTASSLADDENEPPPGVQKRSREAIAKFWTIYHGNDYGAIPQVQEQLGAAIQHDANNATLHALLGATYFWHVGESARDPKQDQRVLAQDMPTAVGFFQRALDLDYSGARPIGSLTDDHLPGYLGITSVHAGQQRNDPALIARGDEVLDYAVYQFPEFNNFNRWAAHNSDPKDSEAYRKALDSLWQAIDTCVGGQIDRLHPDMRPYLHLQTSVGRKKACWSQGDLAPHSFEGFMLNLGNGLVKAGQIEAARTVFANARYAAGYETWPYRYELERVASSDLFARAALYADPDPRNDPPFGVPNRGCVYCHAKVAEPPPSTGR
jgi:hypothetical protein